VKSVSAGTTSGREECYLNVFCSALDAQKGALQNFEGAETPCEYLLKLLTRAKVGERERFVLLADGIQCFTFVTNAKVVRYEPSN
jgi:hypothetical protein